MNKWSVWNLNLNPIYIYIININASVNKIHFINKINIFNYFFHNRVKVKISYLSK